MQLGGSGCGYPGSLAEMEGFSRLFWGMVPLLAGGGDDPLWETCLQGIINGTDSSHVEYWGESGDYDQRFVEMAVFGLALALIPDRVWEPLTEPQKDRLAAWLGQCNQHPVFDCNWLFFPVLVNMGFCRLGLPYDQAGMERNLNRIENFSLSGGWYSDGEGGHSDYYTPIAIHYFSLIYAKLMEHVDPARCGRFKARSTRFAKDFIRWFAPDGSALPYGRSLTYRFAQSAFWSAMAFAGVESEAIPMGVIKGLVLRNLRWWFSKPIFRPDGALSVGYAYPNLVMAENYNGPGSPYWAMKTFLPLALPDDHPFWQAEELSLPELPPRAHPQHPTLDVVRDPGNGHVVAFNAGHSSTNEHTHTSAKYEKFAYSNVFGFSVPRAEWGLSQGAIDSMLALSERDNLFRVRRRNEESVHGAGFAYSRWMPWFDVEVRTWLLTGLPWHIRVHRIETGRVLTAAEGGFALSLDAGLATETSPYFAEAASDAGTVAIHRLVGFEEALLIYPQANTNLLHPRTVIPTLQAELTKGSHVAVSAVYGQPQTVPLIRVREQADAIAGWWQDIGFDADISLKGFRELAESFQRCLFSI